MKKILAAIAASIALFIPTAASVSTPPPAHAASCYPPSGAVATINDHQKTDPNPWTDLNVRNYIGCYSDTCPGSGCSISPLVWQKQDGRRLYVYFDANRFVKYACATSGTSCFVPPRLVAHKDSSWPW